MTTQRQKICFTIKKSTSFTASAEAAIAKIHEAQVLLLTAIRLNLPQ
jgi:hypothetical protein